MRDDGGVEDRVWNAEVGMRNAEVRMRNAEMGRWKSMPLRIDVISVGAAFQPRFSNYGVRVIYFRGWKATPTRSWC